MINNPLVSCIIPSYKRSITLRRSIDSVLSQTYKNVEVLVVDDNIPDDEYSKTLSKIIDEYYYDTRVKIVSQVKHINGAEARNAGVRAANGEYVAFLDDDDEWFPNKLELQIQIMESDNTIDGVAGGTTLWKDGIEISKWRPIRTSEDNMQFRVLTRDIRFATSSFLCKKTSFLEMGGFDVSLIRSQDLQLFTDFLTNHRIYPLTYERTTKMNVEDSSNRLDAVKLAKNKKDFFNSIASVMADYPKSVQVRIRSAHHYEVAFIAIKEGKYLFAFKHILLGLMSLASLKDLYKRIKER